MIEESLGRLIEFGLEELSGPVELIDSDDAQAVCFVGWPMFDLTFSGAVEDPSVGAIIVFGGLAGCANEFGGSEQAAHSGLSVAGAGESVAVS